MRLHWSMGVSLLTVGNSILVYLVCTILPCLHLTYVKKNIFITN